MSETTLAPVTFVRDVVGFPYAAETVNKLWRTQEGRHVLTSFLTGVSDGGNPETLGIYVGEDAVPDVPSMVSYLYGGGQDPWIEAPEPAHEAVLAILGYKVVPENQVE